MSQQELLKKVVQTLKQAGIEYMLTGSIVSSLQGEPRSTHDIDMVIAIRKTSVKTLTQIFKSPDYYLDEDSIYAAIDRRSMFNLIDVTSGDKVDFWMLTDEPFDQSRFARRVSEEFVGLKIVVSKPEDTILAKLKWTRLSGGSEKHFTDALRVFEVQYGKLDLDYLKKWAVKLGVEPLFEKIRGQAEIQEAKAS